MTKAVTNPEELGGLASQMTTDYGHLASQGRMAAGTAEPEEVCHPGPHLKCTSPCGVVGNEETTVDLGAATVVQSFAFPSIGKPKRTLSKEHKIRNLWNFPFHQLQKTFL